MKKKGDTTEKNFSHQISEKKYWEEQALSSDDALKIVRTLPEDTPEFILKLMTEFEIDVARFCFEGFSGLVLDAGCGTGEILIHALRLYPETNINYVGLDFSEKILKKACDRAKVKPNALLLQGSVTDMPFKDNTFDRIVCSGIIWYLASPDEVVVLIGECYRILKPGGILAVDCLNRFSPSIMVLSLLRGSYTKPPRYVSPLWFVREIKKFHFTVISYRGFNFGLFAGYKYLLRGRWNVFDPCFIQERWSRFIETKIVPHVEKISFLGHRVYVKCQKRD